MQSSPVLIFLGVVILVFAWSVFGFMSKMIETSRNRKIVEDKIKLLEEQKTKLSSDIDKLNTSDGLEASIRDKFGLAKEGEGLVVVVDDKNQTASAVSSESGGFWSFFKNLFK